MGKGKREGWLGMGEGEGEGGGEGGWEEGEARVREVDGFRIVFNIAFS